MDKGVSKNRGRELTAAVQNISTQKGNIESSRVRSTIQKIARFLLFSYFFLSFFEPYLNGVLGSVMKYYLLLVMAAVLVQYGYLKMRWYHIFFLAWSALKVVSLLWTSNTTIANRTWTSHVGMTLLFVIVTGACSDDHLNDLLVKATYSGGLAVGVLSIFFHRGYEGVANRQVLVLFGYENDPNNQAAFLTLGIAAAIILILNSPKSKGWIVFHIAAIGINLYSLFMTGSRAGLITAAMIAVYVFLFAGKTNTPSGFTKKILLLAFVSLIGYVIITQFLPEEIYVRLFELDEYNGGSGRTEIWANAWELSWKDLNFVFGAGWGAHFGYNGMTRSLHNTFLSVFCNYGIVGFLLLFVPIGVCFVKFHKAKMVGLNCLLIAMIISIFFLEAINKRFFWNVIILGFLFYNRIVDEGKVADKAVLNTNTANERILQQ